MDVYGRALASYRDVDVKRRQQLKANRNSTLPYVPVGGTDLSVLQYRYVDGCVFRQGRRGRSRSTLSTYVP